MNTRFLKLCIALIILIPFSFATTPLPPPYHEFSVRGVLERPAGGSRKDFAIVLCAKSKFLGDTTFQILRGIGYSNNDIPIGLTDSSGAFYVKVSDGEVDSLVLAVVVPDRSLELGIPFFVDNTRAVAYTETYESGGTPGCSGCSTGPEIRKRVAYYSHYFDDKVISISF